MARGGNPKAAGEGLDGFVVVDKPAGMTSHDVVSRARRLLFTCRVGHAGTLDPAATGVLVLGIGRATRLLRYVSGLSKCYRGEIVFGATTSTLDDQGEIDGHYEMADLSASRIREAAESFLGTTAQVPPMVSAIKVDGVPLYRLARQGIEIGRAARSVTISRFVVEPDESLKTATFDVECSSGTYVRSLVADLGRALGGGAHLRNLRRTSIGGFDLSHSRALDDLRREVVAPCGGLVAHLSSIAVDDDLVEDIAHGKLLERRLLGIAGSGPWAVFSRSSTQLLAIYEPWTADRIKPAVVLVEPSILPAAEPLSPMLDGPQ